MKKIIFFLATLLVVYTCDAQNRFETLVERPNEKSLVGVLSKEVLNSETTFTWFAENYKAYQPHTGGLATLKNYRDSLQLLAFMGTWCEDSHFIIPRFFSMAETAGIDPQRIVLIGVNRKKETWGDLTKTMGIVNVPTILVFRNGKEIGRVIEYGKYGQFDRELGEIIQQSFSGPR
ncbi:MAG: thioredoxin family protein [Bacteroidota bacterium]